MALKDLFIDVTTLPAGPYGAFQLLTLGCLYAYLLCFLSSGVSEPVIKVYLFFLSLSSALSISNSL